MQPPAAGTRRLPPCARRGRSARGDGGARADDAPAALPAAPPGGWQRAWAATWGATGLIMATVQRLLLGLIALVIVAGIVMRVWSTLMGREVPREEGGMRWRQWQG